MLSRLRKEARYTKLIELTDRISYLPHNEEYDRPALAYIKGDDYSLAVDAGYCRTILRHVLPQPLRAAAKNEFIAYLETIE